MKKINYLEILNKNYKDSNIYKRFLLGTNFDFIDKKILDYGSGNGKLFEFLIQHGAKKENLTGVDIEKEHLDYIMDNIGVQNLSLVNIDNQKTNLKNEEFDIIFCLDVIEHSNKPDDLLTELKRLIKPTGIIILCTPNRWTRHLDKKLLKELKIYQIVKFNINRFLGKAFLDPTHVKEYNPNEFKLLLKKHNFKVIKHNFSIINYIPYLSTKSFIVHLKK